MSLVHIFHPLWRWNAFRCALPSVSITSYMLQLHLETTEVISNSVNAVFFSYSRSVKLISTVNIHNLVFFSVMVNIIGNMWLSRDFNRKVKQTKRVEECTFSVRRGQSGTDWPWEECSTALPSVRQVCGRWRGWKLIAFNGMFVFACCFRCYE